MYADGKGTPQDFVASYKWREIAKATAHPRFNEYRIVSEAMNQLAPKVTPEQVAMAQQQASRWFNAHQRRLGNWARTSPTHPALRFMEITNGLPTTQLICELTHRRHK